MGKCKSQNYLIKMSEKELYSKVSVAESINFVVDDASDEVTNLTAKDKISCYLTTILARDGEVVAVRLKVSTGGCKIYISKNFDWLKGDVEYTNKIQEHLR